MEKFPTIFEYNIVGSGNVFKIIDKTFDTRQFKSLMEYLEGYATMAILSSDSKFNCLVTNKGVNYLGNRHKIVVIEETRSSTINKSFHIEIFENQSTDTKGYMYLSVSPLNSDLKKLESLLKESGYSPRTKKKKIGAFTLYEIRLSKPIIEEVQTLIPLLKDYIP